MSEVRHPARVASPGVAYGTLRCDSSDVGAEQEPVQGIVAAILVAAAQLRRLQGRADGLGAEILGFQLELLEDDQLVRDLLEASKTDADAKDAIRRVFGEQIAAFEASGSERFASRAADLADLRDRLLSAFEGRTDANEIWPDETILLVQGLTPSRFLALDRSKVIGIVDRNGSTASHVALLARAEGLPMLVGAGTSAGTGQGRPALLDAERGELVIDPAAAGSARRGEVVGPPSISAGEGEGPARLPGGETVAVQLTVNSLDALGSAPSGWFDGIGLVRSELLIRNAQMLRDMHSQAALYRPLFEWAGRRPVTVRLIDAGGDKQVPGLALPDSEAGFPGLRGARLLMRHGDVLRTQLAAILAASEGRAVRIMVPMVALPEEMAFFRAELDRALDEAGTDRAQVMLGMMVETPAAALQVACFDADFYALGTNDLSQYTLGASRDGDVLSGREDLPGAVLELVRRVVGHAAKERRSVTLCGDVAATPGGLGRLIECGVRSVCVPPRLAIPFKRFIRSGGCEPDSESSRAERHAAGEGGSQLAGQ